MPKYPIKKEFFPFSHFTPPISEGFLRLAVPNMKTPGFIHKSKDVSAKPLSVQSYDSESIGCFLFSPRDAAENLPCLIYVHGGGFVLPAAGYHYKNAMRYARDIGCRVLFVNYRLAPQNRHPVFFEDAYAAMCLAYSNADALGIDRTRIGVGGDSAGAAIAVGIAMMAKDRGHPVKLRFQMLPYPFLDARNCSESCRKYTDTPMWNSSLSSRISPMTAVDRSRPDYVYYSPVEADSFDGLPPAYIETAEFDCLHDDGILYAEKLREAGIPVTLNETRGTMHGFDIVQRAETTEMALKARIGFMKQAFGPY